jgi:uncharacterized Zn-finger protein
VLSVGFYTALESQDPLAMIDYGELYVPEEKNVCQKCGKLYKRPSSLQRHLEYECDKPPRFGCIYCPYRCKRKDTLKMHTVTCKNKRKL